MKESHATPRHSTPWHLWVVGILALLWNGFSAFDYLMTQTENEGYMGNFTAEQVEYSTSVPAWFVAFWALAVWGGVVAAILLLLRKRQAAVVFLVSLVSMVITAIYQFLFTDVLEIAGTLGVVHTLVLFVVALLLWRYARAMAARGVLS